MTLVSQKPLIPTYLLRANKEASSLASLSMALTQTCCSWDLSVYNSVDIFYILSIMYWFEPAEVLHSHVCEKSRQHLHSCGAGSAVPINVECCIHFRLKA